MEPSLSDSYKDHISNAIATINATYQPYQSFLYALKDVPGNDGVTDVYVAQESISNITDHKNSVLNLSVIVQTEDGINLADARSRVTEALNGYAAENTHRITYEFRTFDDYHSPDGTRRGALTSIHELARSGSERSDDVPEAADQTEASEDDAAETRAPYDPNDRAFRETKRPEGTLETLVALGS